MFHDESWKRIYLGSKVKGQGHESVTKYIAGMGLCTLVECWLLFVAGILRFDETNVSI